MIHRLNIGHWITALLLSMSIFPQTTHAVQWDTDSLARVFRNVQESPEARMQALWRYGFVHRYTDLEVAYLMADSLETMAQHHGNLRYLHEANLT
ncbi:MAG: hypothetical protein AAF570_17725, partial [Bacteroidota bacterium]